MTIPASRLTAFDAYRVTEPFTMADIVNRYSLDADLWGTRVTGAGAVAHAAATSSIDLSVTTASGDLCELETHEHYRYHAGKGQRVTQSVYLTSTQNDQRARWGLFEDATDGLFWEVDDGTLYCVVRSSVSGSAVDTRVAKSAFNGGADLSALDLTKANIFEVSFQWLGVGAVQWLINGELVHTSNHANTVAGPYMKTAQLPVRYEIENTAASTANTLHAICVSVTSEGGGSPSPERGFAVGASNAAVSNTEIPLLSLQPSATLNSVSSRVDLAPKLFDIGFEDDGIARVYLNPATLVGASFASHLATSGMDVDTSATSFTTDGSTILLAEFYVDSTAPRSIDLSPMFAHLGRRLVRLFPSGQTSLLVTVEKRSGGTTTAHATIAWREII